MSRFNLNEMSMMNTGTTSVFNNGIAGKVEGVKVEVAKRRADEPESYPAYKLTFTDKTGASVNQGFYYFTPKQGVSDEQNEKLSGYLISRVLETANAVVPEGFVYPEIPETGDNVKDTNVALDILFGIIRDNSETKANVFVTYGTKTNPSKYLGLRYFNYIERTGKTGYSRLTAKGDDMMERLTEDSPKVTPEGTITSGPAW